MRKQIKKVQLLKNQKNRENVQINHQNAVQHMLTKKKIVRKKKNKERKNDIEQKLKIL